MTRQCGHTGTSWPIEEGAEPLWETLTLAVGEQQLRGKPGVAGRLNAGEGSGEPQAEPAVAGAKKPHVQPVSDVGRTRGEAAELGSVGRGVPMRHPMSWSWPGNLPSAETGLERRQTEEP